MILVGDLMAVVCVPYRLYNDPEIHITFNSQFHCCTSLIRITHYFGKYIYL